MEVPLPESTWPKEKNTKTENNLRLIYFRSKYICKGEKIMGFRLQINFSDGESMLIDDVFETEEDANAEYEVWLEI